MKRIAVVEDNPDNRLLVRAILEDSYEIEEYESGVDALNEIPANPPDLVLLDISLPEINGMDVLASIRKNPKIANLPVIALTAHAMEEDRNRFLAAGFDWYLTKPIEDDVLLMDAIESCLSRHSEPKS